MGEKRECRCNRINAAYGGCMGALTPCDIRCLPQVKGPTCWEKAVGAAAGAAYEKGETR